MLLSYNEICELIEQGVIEFADYDCVNSASLDIHIGDHVLREADEGSVLVLRDRTPLKTVQHRLPFDVLPGEFVLAPSREVFHLPNYISAEYKLKSSMARIALDHLNAGWCDAGWNGSVLTLELKNVSNNHAIRLHKGDAIGQMVFFKHSPVPYDKSYEVRGRYNNDKTAQGVKK
ncbi:deoxycytidine deaminase [EBPR podovirus 3]|nr:deoxycytidine deaminase [EBPR podovirus 3]